MSFPDPFHMIQLVALGGGLGFAGGMFGLGGGIIAIPVLILGFGLDQSMAQGTALVMMVPNLLIAWWRYTRHHPIPWRDAVGVAVAGIATTGLTAQVAAWLDQGLLRTLFALFLLVLAVRMARQKTTAPSAQAVSRRFMPLVGSAGGASMGLLGVGGGLVATPLFCHLFGLRQAVAQSFGLALVAPCSVIALSTYAGHQQVDWPIGSCLAIGGIFTVAAGVRVAHHLPEQHLRRCFAGVLAVTGLWLIVGATILGWLVGETIEA